MKQAQKKPPYSVTTMVLTISSPRHSEKMQTRSESTTS